MRWRLPRPSSFGPSNCFSSAGSSSCTAGISASGSSTSATRAREPSSSSRTPSHDSFPSDITCSTRASIGTSQESSKSPVAVNIGSSVSSSSSSSAFCFALEDEVIFFRCLVTGSGAVSSQVSFSYSIGWVVLSVERALRVDGFVREYWERSYSPARHSWNDLRMFVSLVKYESQPSARLRSVFTSVFR
ncbi:hypothetical protein GGU10DRAFT_340183 [Lentinula aff. detonsa]|uniref:Uncharacterized protein n=1 Tax=Lentinula aff. detonsa TaxID=2804958 RepID=A0AA38U057_9AGAR|nr:hypothetical protein GGU10DRAFT_340183 [Lentinula aff. detonsa]